MSREDQIKYAEQIIACGCSDELKAILEKDFPELTLDKDKRIKEVLSRNLEGNAQFRWEIQRIGLHPDDVLFLIKNQKEQDSSIRSEMKELIDSERQLVVLSESYGKSLIKWDTKSIDSAIMLLEGGLDYLGKKNNKPKAFIPKFQVGDKVISTRNYHLTYKILEVGNINELGNLEYKVEIFADGKAGINKEPHNIHFIECRKMDEWGELIEPRPIEWQDDYREEDLQTRFAFYTYKDEPNVLFLSNLFVEEASRNKGLGTRILQSAEGVARAFGASSIMLQAKLGTPAIDLYSKNGFECITEQGGYGWFEKKVEVTTVNSSEENEKVIHLACEFIRRRVRANDSIGGVNCRDLIEKLKSIQLGTQWSKDDEAALDYLIDYCNSQENGRHPVLETSVARKLSNWLYRLKSGEISSNPHSCRKPSSE